MSRERGQIAVGLAFAFTTVLAIFTFVFQSSLLTREKIKLQGTSDFAALVCRRCSTTVLEYHSEEERRNRSFS